MKKTIIAILGIVIAVILVVAGRFLAIREGWVRRDTVDNRPLLEKSALIHHFESPNLVITSTGDRLHLNGFVFNEHISDATPESLQRAFRHHEPVRISTDPTLPSGIAAELRIEYWCGNSFRQSFWPKPPLPRYRVDDLGRILAYLGVGELTKDKQNKAEMATPRKPSD